MEIIGFLVLILVIAVVVGAFQGMAALTRAHRLEIRVAALERRLVQLQESRPAQPIDAVLAHRRARVEQDRAQARALPGSSAPQEPGKARMEPMANPDPQPEVVHPLAPDGDRSGMPSPTPPARPPVPANADQGAGDHALAARLAVAHSAAGPDTNTAPAAPAPATVTPSAVPVAAAAADPGPLAPPATATPSPPDASAPHAGPARAIAASSVDPLVSAAPARAFSASDPVDMTPLSAVFRAAATPSPSNPSSPPQNLEAMLSQRWLTWGGVGILFLAAAFFLKYAYDQGWIGHLITAPVRIALILVAGAAGAGIGWHLQRRGMAALGQGLAGFGIALAYLAVYGAYSPDVGIVAEPLCSPVMAFAGMAVVSALGMLGAVSADALAMAVIATVGGLVTPALISTGHPDRDLLGIYLLVLDGAAVGAAAWRQWRGLVSLAFIGTNALMIAATGALAPSAPDLAMLPWLAVFHALFLVAAFIRGWRLRTPVVGEDFALAIANLAVQLGWAAHILHADHQSALALTVFAAAALYLAVGEAFRRRCPADALVGEGFAVLAAALGVLGLFWLLPVEVVAISWVVESCTVAWFGLRYARPWLLLTAQAVMVIAILRIVVLHALEVPYADDLLLNPWLMNLLVAPLGAFALAWVLGRKPAPVPAPLLAVAGTAGSWWAALAALMVLVAVTADLVRHAGGHAAAWTGWPLLSVIGAWWLAGAVAVMAWTRWRPLSPSDPADVLPRNTLTALTLVLGVLVPAAAYGDALTGASVMVFNLRFAVAAAAVVVMAWEALRTPVVGWAAYVYAILLGSAEAVANTDSAGEVWPGWALPTVLAAWWAVAGLAVMGWSRQRPGAVGRGFAQLLPAAALAAAAVPFVINDHIGAWMFIAPRFLVAAIAVVLMAVNARRDPIWGWLAYVVAVVLVSLEPSEWCWKTIPDRREAEISAHLAVTIAWTVSASALLAAGFTWRQRAWRLAALGLFALTAGKLLMIDMADAQQLTRIASFAVLGMVLIGAAYAYHRLERWMG
jgi:uncharacterized membrane protein